MDKKATATVGVGIASVILTGTAISLHSIYKKYDKSITSDGELEGGQQKCKCIFATQAGISVVVGIISGTLTWILY